MYKAENIKICIKLLEELRGYNVQFVPFGNVVASSSPSELASTTYKNIETKVEGINEHIFYCTLTEITGHKIDPNSKIDGFSLGYGNQRIKEKINNMIEILKITLFLNEIN